MAKQTPELDKPVLLITDGPLSGQQWVMHNDEIVVGRGSHCQIVIPERRVSREHIRIWREQDRYFVEDLDSKNGTHVNAVKLDEVHELEEGDEIQIALCVKIRFIGSEATVPLSLEEQEQESMSLSQRGLVLDTKKRQLTINGRLLQPQLSLYQYRLLELLVRLNGNVCTREEVIHAVWPDAAEAGISEQAIDALVRRLRDRLTELSPDHQYIRTVRGHGFQLIQPDDG
ncbi:MAG: FHA domain-containing protein [Chloroflexota bacterium]